MKPRFRYLLSLGCVLLLLVAGAVMLRNQKPPFIPPKIDPQAIADADKVLLGVEYWEEKGEWWRAFVGLKFRQGVYLGKHTFWVGTEEHLVSSGKCYFLAERYWIYDRKVLDLVGGRIFDGENTLVIDGSKGLCKLIIDRHKVVYRVESWPKIECFVFDLDEWRLEKMDRTTCWYLPGVHSPRQTKSADVDFTDDFVRFHFWDGSTKTFANAGKVMSWHGSIFGAAYVESLTLWLDDERVLIQLWYGILGVLHSDGSVTILTIGHVFPMLFLDRFPIYTPRLYRDALGRIVYQCGCTYLLDVETGKYEQTDWRSVGNGFEREVDWFGNDGPRFRHHGKLITRAETEFAWEQTTAQKYIAVQYIENGSSRGIKVWNSHAQQWIAIEMPLRKLIGWIDGGIRQP